MELSKLEWGLHIGWLTLLGAGVVFLIWKAFQTSQLVGVIFLALLIVGGLIGWRIEEESLNGLLLKRLLGNFGIYREPL